MESKCDMVRSVSIILPNRNEGVAVPFQVKDGKIFQKLKEGVIIPKNSVEAYNKDNVKINFQKAIPIPIQIITKPNADIKRIKISTSGFPKIANIKKIEKIDFQNPSVFDLPFFKAENCVISCLKNDKSTSRKKFEDCAAPCTDAQIQVTKKNNSSLISQAQEPVSLDNDAKSDPGKLDESIVVTDVNDFQPAEYGCTLSEDDFNLIDLSQEEGDDNSYFEDYGIDNFYALSTERSEFIKCNPMDVIIGKDVSLKDASIYPDDLKMYFFASLADKDNPLHSSNISSILISKVLKNLENSMPKAKRKCQ